MGGFGMNQFSNAMFQNPAMDSMMPYAQQNALQQAGTMGHYSPQQAPHIAQGSLMHFNQSLGMMREQMRQQQMQGMLTALMQMGGLGGTLAGYGMHQGGGMQQPWQPSPAQAMPQGWGGGGGLAMG